MLTVMQIARRIPWLIMGLILVAGLLHLFGRVNLFSSLAPPTRRMNSNRRFPPPWSVEDIGVLFQ
jgi:hypothetical protein